MIKKKYNEINEKGLLLRTIIMSLVYKIAYKRITSKGDNYEWLYDECLRILEKNRKNF